MLEKNLKLFFFSILLFCKKSLSVLHLKTWKKWLVEVAECSVCQFVKSNCLIGFDQGDGWFGTARRNSRKKDKLRRDHWDIEIKYWWYHWKIGDIIEGSVKLLEFGDQAHRLGGVPVVAAAPVQELVYERFFCSLTFHCNCLIFWA